MTDTSLLVTVLIALFGGLFPAILWVIFWLREDNFHPEPKRRIIFCFLYGAIAVPFAFISELGIAKIFLNTVPIQDALSNAFILGVVVVTIWALLEEVLKYSAAHFGGIRWKSNDEPIDVVIYLILAALGFAALENILFLIEPLIQGDVHTAVITSNMRFVGASLLHVATSGVIGLFIAFSYFKEQTIKKRYFLGGLITAVILHTIFNLFIINNENNILPTFFAVWFVIIVIIIILERIKKIHLNKINT